MSDTDAAVAETTVNQPEQTAIEQASQVPPTEPNMQVVKVQAQEAPKQDIRVMVARQTCDFWTKPEWPEEEDLEKPTTIVMRGDGLFRVESEVSTREGENIKR